MSCLVLIVRKLKMQVILWFRVFKKSYNFWSYKIFYCISDLAAVKMATTFFCHTNTTHLKTFFKLYLVCHMLCNFSNLHIFRTVIVL